MVPTQPTLKLRGFGMLLRIIAVVSSSVATILSGLLPLLFYYSLSSFAIISVLCILLIGTILVHGVLTHTFNDLTDYQSGTDEHSPALLSGGSRVLQSGLMSVRMLIYIGAILSILLLLISGMFFTFGYTKFAILTLIGIWSAASYSLRPFQFAYYPFIGEWLSLFPAMVLLGIAAPWILLEHMPIWAWQNALVNAVWCMAWVMVHHIPDRHADRKAQPIKRTSVVWAEDRFGKQAAKVPALLYFILVGLLLAWVVFTRPIGGLATIFILLYGIHLIIKMDRDDIEEVTRVEKLLLLFAFITSIWLGLFI